MGENYSRRVWLNAPSSSSSGSVVAFDGIVNYGSGHDTGPYTYLEIADCHNKARLHRAYGDTPEEFLAKMESLHDVISEFICYLKNKPKEIKPEVDKTS